MVVVVDDPGAPALALAGSRIPNLSDASRIRDHVANERICGQEFDQLGIIVESVPKRTLSGFEEVGAGVS